MSKSNVIEIARTSSMSKFTVNWVLIIEKLFFQGFENQFFSSIDRFSDRQNKQTKIESQNET